MMPDTMAIPSGGRMKIANLCPLEKAPATTESADGRSGRMFPKRPRN